MAKKDEGRLSLTEMIKTLKIGELKNVYLFYGEEDYLKDFFAKKIIERYEASADAITYLEGKKLDADTIYEAVSSSPLLMTSPFVIVSNSGIFSNKNKCENFDFLKDIDEGCIIFKENEADKSNVNYKVVAECGIAFECARQPESEIVKILTNRANVNGRHITPAAISLLYSGLGNNILLLCNEVDKLAMLVNEGESIDVGEVKAATELSIEAKTYDFTDAIAEKNKEKALIYLNKMVEDKIPVQILIASIANHFIKLTNVERLLSEGKKTQEISEYIHASEYPTKKYMRQSKLYSRETLEAALEIISDIDIRSKNGKIDGIAGIELIIQQLSAF